MLTSAAAAELKVVERRFCIINVFVIIFAMRFRCWLSFPEAVFGKRVSSKLTKEADRKISLRDSMRYVRLLRIFMKGLVESSCDLRLLASQSLLCFARPTFDLQTDVAETLVYRFVSASQIFVCDCLDVVEHERTLRTLRKDADMSSMGNT